MCTCIATGVYSHFRILSNGYLKFKGAITRVVSVRTGSLTLGAHAPEGYGSWVCVCVSVTLHLTSRMSVRLINDTTYLTGNEGQKYRAVFSENGPLQS